MEVVTDLSNSRKISDRADSGNTSKEIDDTRQESTANIQILIFNLFIMQHYEHVISFPIESSREHVRL